MWLVNLALRRPYSVATLCLVILMMGVLSIFRMKTDVLPAVNIPVVVVVWNYSGLSAQDMESRVVLVAERGYSTSVDNIDHIESESINGIGLIKLYMAGDADIGAAIGQVTAQSMQSLRFMPTGMQPPSILQFNASNVQVAQITMSSNLLSAQEMFDYATQFLRLKLFTIEGMQLPPPYGGSGRQVAIDLDPFKLASKQLSPQDVVNAILASNVILPAGISRMGGHEYDISINGSPVDYASFNRVPVKVVNGRTVYVGDVAHAHDGYGNLFNTVHVNGRRAVYLAVLKKSNASTLAIVDATRDMLPSLKAAAPEGLELKLDFDQSTFVRAAINGVLRESLISAALVALMVFGFLGSWRSVIIVCTSIPLAVLCSVIGLSLSGMTLNLMTLGGLALSIGMLVDDATVEVENIHRNRVHEKRLAVAILDSASQVATPALATTLTICIVFFPVVMLTGPAKFLFIPLALGVVIAMVASYLLSRTLVPAMAHLLMKKEEVHGAEGEQGRNSRTPGETAPKRKPGRLARLNAWRDRQFERLEDAYESALRVALSQRALVLGSFFVLLVASGFLARVVGLDFFPNVDTGQMKLHLRAPPGMRLDDTEVLAARVQDEIRKIIPTDELETINDNIGAPISINLGYIATDNVNSGDADILIALTPKHHPSEGYIERMRRELPVKFPGTSLYFQSADVISQVLNFGTSAAIDVQIQGRDLEHNYQLAQKIKARVSRIPGAVDVHIPQVTNHPELRVNVDRERAAQLGLAEKDVASSLLTSLTGSSLVSPSFFVDPKTNVNYSVVVQTPFTDIDSVNALLATPIVGSVPTANANSASPGTPGALEQSGDSLQSALSAPGQAPYLGSIATILPNVNRSVINHYTAYPIVEVQCGVGGRDLGAVASDIQRIVDDEKKLPKGTEIHIRGQSEQMFRSFGRLALGLILAIALVYLLLATLLQSWLDPLIIMIAIPGALIGVLWMLMVTGTTINVESLMGTIMVVGIAVSNSNLLVNFANDLRGDKERKVSAVDAAVEAGKTRLRPVLMTAIAMLLGMLPMALALGEGGEQNAPLGRAVIGGLLVATFVTLFAVPIVYSLLRKAPPRKQTMDAEFEKEIADDPPAPAENHG
ncbi:MAG: efflux RND transporter permease subunit [Pseudomonadota bacterium]